ncbi:MAG: metal ABC transporter solute-binding protein, Zn/Mn family [Bacteroidia bacterium]
MFRFVMVLFMMGLGQVAWAQKMRVVATTSFLADMAQVLAGDFCEVSSLLPLGSDPHTYDAVPGDARKLAEANLIIENGLNLEGWLSKLIEQAGGNTPRIRASDGVIPIMSSEYADSYDPHAWMDPLAGRIYIRNISRSLQALLPQSAEAIEANYLRYDSSLLVAHQQITELIAAIPPKHRLIATTHDAFRYFGERYGMEVISVLGTTTDAEVRTGDLQQLIRTIEAYELPAIFVETTINPKLMQQVATDAGIRIGGNLYADSMGPKGSGADTYLRMLLHTAQSLHDGLKGSGTNRKNSTDLLMLMIIAGFFLAAFLYLGAKIQSKNRHHAPINGNIRIKGLTVAYDNKVILNDFNLELKPGKLYGLIGPNGSGKSTLFKSILGLADIDRGSIEIGDLNIKEVQTQIAYVPQKEDIDWEFPATVSDVVLMGRYAKLGVFSQIHKNDFDQAHRHMEELGIMNLMHKQIGELSGGQQQRVFIARALCQEARIYFLDEPFVGVDITTEEKIMQVLRALVKEGKTVIMIHHDLSKAREYFDEIIMINRRLVAFGAPEKVVNEQNILRTFSGMQSIYEEAVQLNKLT